MYPELCPVCEGEGEIWYSMLSNSCRVGIKRIGCPGCLGWGYLREEETPEITEASLWFEKMVREIQTTEPEAQRQRSEAQEPIFMK